MNLHSLKTLFISALVTIAIGASSFYLSAAQAEGEFLVNGKWVKGTLYAAGISIGDGKIDATPPWAIIGPDGVPVDVGKEGGSWPYRFPLGKSILASSQICISDKDGFSINSPVPLDIAIYDVSGKCVYSATGQNNAVIDRNTLIIQNGMYLLRLVNKEGVSETMRFMLDNDSFIHQK